ncbi:MAG: hypothetical protein U1D30_26130 [Planctomycetota bacterium]
MLATITIPVALEMNDGRQLRDTSRTLQAVFAGAREQAMSSDRPVGLRLISDPNDASIVRSLQYIEESPPMIGKAMVVHANWPTPFSPSAAVPTPIINTVVLLGANPNTLKSFLPSYLDASNNPIYTGTIRIGNSGDRLNFTATEAGLDFNYGGNPYPKLTLKNAITLPIPFGTSVDLSNTNANNPTTGEPWHPDCNKFSNDPLAVGTDFVIPLGYRPRAGEDPIILPAGIVIDLGYIPPPAPNNSSQRINPPSQQLSAIRPSFVGYDQQGKWDIRWDIMISPSGRVIGSAAAEPQVILWIREQTAGVDVVTVGTDTSKAGTDDGFRKLIRTVGTGNHALLAIFTRTGRVQSSLPNLGELPPPSTLPAPVDKSIVTFNGVNYYNPYGYYQFVLSGSRAGM